MNRKLNRIVHLMLEKLVYRHETLAELTRKHRRRVSLYGGQSWNWGGKKLLKKKKPFVLHDEQHQTQPCVEDCFLCLPGLLCTSSPCQLARCLSQSLRATHRSPPSASSSSAQRGHSRRLSPHRDSCSDISLAGTSCSQNLQTRSSFGQSKVCE